MNTNTETGAGSGTQVTARAECEAALIEVLETMFFELPADGSTLAGAPPGAAIAVTAAFSGDLNGSLSIASGFWAMRRLAASFLGREDESTVTEAEIRQVACELANMVCGNALSRIEPHGRFRIATPELCMPGPGSRRWITFPLESGDISVTLEAGS
ncbi:MAG: chemotaxis protein CheX [Bryobacteraceae bacterium]|nr:chemotaxis protein CheX [Bryobacteraceae bacterium]